MTRPNDGGPAFPIPPIIWKNKDGSENVAVSDFNGMTLRDYFAAEVLKSACEDSGPSNAAAMSYQYADAMIAERKKQCTR